MEYFHLGNSQNGIYKIRPTLNSHAFKVECEFTESEGITIIKPLEWLENGYAYPPRNNNRCFEPNCFTHNFKYGVDLEQIEVNIVIKIYIYYYISVTHESVELLFTVH